MEPNAFTQIAFRSTQPWPVEKVMSNAVRRVVIFGRDEVLTQPAQALIIGTYGRLTISDAKTLMHFDPSAIFAHTCCCYFEAAAKAFSDFELHGAHIIGTGLSCNGSPVEEALVEHFLATGEFGFPSHCDVFKVPDQHHWQEHHQELEEKNERQWNLSWHKFTL